MFFQQNDKRLKKNPTFIYFKTFAYNNVESTSQYLHLHFPWSAIINFLSQKDQLRPADAPLALVPSTHHSSVTKAFKSLNKTMPPSLCILCGSLLCLEQNPVLTYQVVPSVIGCISVHSGVLCCYQKAGAIHTVKPHV